MLLYLVSSLFISTISATGYCYGQSECASTTISENYIRCYGYESCEYSTMTSQAIYCFGYRSCLGSSITSTYCHLGGNNGAKYATNVSAGLDISCYGENSCYGVGQLEAKNDIFCAGHYGCARSTMIAKGDIFCGGSYGCTFSDITVGGVLYTDGDLGAYFADVTFTGSSPSFVSYGYLSAMYGDIYFSDDTTSTITVFSRGHKSTYASVIYTGQNNDFKMYIDGYYSSAESDIYCEAGSTCTVYCGGTRGCYRSYLYCTSTSTCSQVCGGSYCLTIATYSGTEEEKSALIEQRKALKSQLLSSGITLDNEKLFLDKTRQITLKTDDIPNVKQETIDQLNREMDELLYNKQQKIMKLEKRLDEAMNEMDDDHNNEDKNQSNSHLISIFIISSVIIALFLFWKYQNNSGKTLDTDYTPIVSNTQYQSV